MKHSKCHHDHLDCPLPADLERLQAEREKLRNLVSVDELTGFFNFRFLKSALEGEMERTHRTGLSTGLIMADLDHFKQVNDTYGHENGNLALQAAARTWKTHIRKIDIPCRYGGEEFVIILPNTKIHDAIRTAERLRAELAAATVALNAEAFIHRVDMFVLDAKQEGRNRVCYDRRKVARPVTEVTTEERESLFTKRKI